MRDTTGNVASLSDRAVPRKKSGGIRHQEDAIMKTSYSLEANMGSIRGWELIIILAIVLLLFGPGRLSRIAGEIGKGIREFRSGIREGDEENPDESDEEDAPNS
jgi:sec-independent protein translocase protein TatA